MEILLEDLSFPRMIKRPRYQTGSLLGASNN